MSNYNDLIKQNNDDDMQRRRKYLETLSDKDLAGSASNPVNDHRNVVMAKRILRERGVKDVPA